MVFCLNRSAKIFVVFAFAAVTLNRVQSARILGVIPSVSYSHQIAYRSLWRELCKRGHELVLLTTDPMNDPSLPNLKEISFDGVYEIWNITEATEKHKYNPFMVLKAMLDLVAKVTDFQINHPQVQQMLTNKTEHFDLVIAEFMTPFMWGLSWRYRCPLVGIFSLDMTTLSHEMLGNPTNPALYTDFQLPFVPPLKFWQRVFSFVFHVLFKVYAEYRFSFTNVLARQHFGDDMPTLQDIGRNASMVFINTNPVLHPMRPVGPNTISVGSFNHIEPPRNLSEDLQAFLDDATGGAIYFSLGTNIKSDSINGKLFDAILGMFRKINHQILWKFDMNITDVPKNVKVINWVPQQDILRHRNVKLFVTQGGLQSIEEAIYFHVPMVAISFFADQHLNSEIIRRKGLGLSLDKSSVTDDKLVEVTMEVMHNPTYKENLIKIQELMSDQPMTGLEKAVWWTEYVLRHNGADHLKNPARHMPLYEYLLLDVLAVIGLVFVVLVLVVRAMFRYLITFLCSGLKRKLKTM